MKYKKRGKPAHMVKNKEQVRHFYYRTWHKISKHIDFANGELPFVSIKQDFIDYMWTIHNSRLFLSVSIGFLQGSAPPAALNSI